MFSISKHRRSRAMLILGILVMLSDSFSLAAVTAEEVLVRGERQALKNYEKIPGTYNQVTAEQIEDIKPTDISDVIRRIPGVNYIDEDGRGLRPNIGLRGFDPNRSKNVLLLLDGFPIQPSSFGDPSTYYHVPVEDIESIDVVKGPQTLLYHTNNAGGVINYISKKPPADSKAQFTNKETFGEDSLFVSQSALAGTVDNLSYRVSYLRKQGEGFRESDAFGVHDVGTYLKYRIDDRQELISNTYWYHENSDTPGGLSRAQYDGNHLQSNTGDDNFQGRRVHTNLTYRNRLTDDNTFETYFYYTFLRRDWFLGSQVAGPGNTQFKRDFNVFGFGAKDEIFYDLSWMENNSFTLGTDFYFDVEKDTTERGASNTSTSGTRTTDNDLTTFAFDIYATTNLQVTERLSVAPIIRLDFVRNGLVNQLTGMGDSDITAAWSPGIGVEYDLHETTSAYASYHRSFSPAEYKEAVNATSGASRDLDAQRGNHFEIGVRSDPLSWLETDLALFTFDFDNEIISAGGVTFNGQESRHSGIESTINVDLFDMAGSLSGAEIPDYIGSLSTNFGLTLLDTDFRKGPNAGNELPYAPNWHYTWGLNYDHPCGFYANLYAQWADEQYSSANNTRVENPAASTGIIPTYKVWDFNTGYDFKERYGVFFGVRNLFNEKYFTRRDTFFTGITPAADRQIYFGVKIKVG